MAAAGLEELTADVGGLSTRYLVAGEGPPVVLVHGGGESNFDWRGVISALSGARRLYAPNLPAVGGTAKPATDDRSPAFYARFVTAFFDALGIERAAVVGASLHGHSVLRLALCEPARVSAAVVIGSSGLGREVNRSALPTVLPGWGELASGWTKTPLGALQRAWGRAAHFFAKPWAVDSFGCDLLAPAPLQGFVYTDHQWATTGHEGLHQQPQQHMAHLSA